MSLLSDTTPDAERVLIAVFRDMPLARKWQTLETAYRDLRLLHAAGVRSRNSTATAEDIVENWLTLHQWPRRQTAKGGTMSLDQNNLSGLREVLKVFARAGISYALGGSMASSLQGIPRATLDADISVEPFASRIPDIVGSFGPDWYVNSAAVQEAHPRQTSFNLVNTATGFKVDVFIRKDHPFERSAMARRIAMVLPDDPEPVMVHSAEDTILFKLKWFRLGDEISDRQWQDILGVLKVQKGRLDEGYLDHWAADLSITDLLHRARLEAS